MGERKSSQNRSLQSGFGQGFVDGFTETGGKILSFAGSVLTVVGGVIRLGKGK